jgi:hypothetical protein
MPTQKSQKNIFAIKLCSLGHSSSSALYVKESDEFVKPESGLGMA